MSEEPDCILDGCTFEDEVVIEVFEGQKWSVTNCTFHMGAKIVLVTSARSLEETRTRLREIEADLAN